jgi:hypothetical protein
MANDGFKGTRLGISAVSIHGSLAAVDVQFVDADGFVHATTRHSISIGEHEELRTTGTAFLDALSAHVSKIHFARPDSPAKQKETQRGIAEALRGGGDDNPDGFEEGS